MGGTRHAKNQCTQHTYSAAERIKDGYGTKKQRIGGDSMLPFGMCPISLKPLVNPMVSHKGHVFSRDAIIEYLASMKQEQLRAQRDYEELLSKEQAEDADAKAADEAAELQEFMEQESGVKTQSKTKVFSYEGKDVKSEADLGGRGAVSYNDLQGGIYLPAGQTEAKSKRPNPYAHAETRPDASKRKKPEGAGTVVRLEGLDQDAMRSKQIQIYEDEQAHTRAFWIPAHTPAAAVRAKKPEKRKDHPWGSYTIKMKNLFPATFTPVDKRSAEEVRTSSLAVTEQDRFMCPVTFKTFARNTKAAFLKPSGHVVSLEVIDMFIKKYGKCPITGKPCTVADVIKLKEGGTGFAGKSGKKLSAKNASARHRGAETDPTTCF